MREDSGRTGVGWNDNERPRFVSFCCRPAEVFFYWAGSKRLYWA